MKKLFIFYNFIVVAIMTFSGFLGCTNIAQLFSAILFFPLFIYFGKMVLPRKKQALVIPAIIYPSEKPAHQKDKLASTPQSSPQILKPHKSNFDLDRRMFLKLIGSAGITVFFFSIFAKKAQASFFGSAPGQGTITLKDSTGATIDPAIKHPTDGYKISRLDDSSPAYYGFTNKDGAWFIMKEDSSGNYTYAVGSSSFSTSWGNRASGDSGLISYGEYFDKF